MSSKKLGPISSDEGTLKKISGKILLALYYLQRQQGYCHEGVISFDRKISDTGKFRKSPLGEKLFEISSFLPDIFNALRYLKEKGFIAFKETNTNADFNFLDILVTADGIDIIEGLVRGGEEKNRFYMIFNIKIEDNSINLDSIIKNEIGSIFKTSVI